MPIIPKKPIVAEESFLELYQWHIIVLASFFAIATLLIVATIAETRAPNPHPASTATDPIHPRAVYLADPPKLTVGHERR